MLYIHQKTMISVQALIVSGSLGWTIFTSFADGFARASTRRACFQFRLIVHYIISRIYRAVFIFEC